MNDLRDVFVGISPSNLIPRGQPVGAMFVGESEIADVIRKAGCGNIVLPGGVAGIQSAILRLKEDASVREAMGSNGRRYLEVNMSLEKNVAFHGEIFCGLTGDGALVRGAVSSSEGAPGVGRHGL